MQLAFDAADRLVELLEGRRAPVRVEEAARALFALAHAPPALAHEVLAPVVEGDARLAWQGTAVGLAGDGASQTSLEDAVFAVVDLETTGLSPERSRICEIGAVRVRGLELDGSFHSLVDPGEPLPAAVTLLTGLRDGELRRAPSAGAAVRRLLAWAGEAVFVAHNARFDLGFLDREVERLTGRRLAAPVVDTVGLARMLLRGRTERAGLASLARFFGTAAEPCHRALPDAEATAEVLLALIGLAQERGARSVADLQALAAPRARRAHAKRALVAGAPTAPGVYLFRDAHDLVLYVGRARELRPRLRSYFRSDRQRPAVEAALAALERVEWRETGSELEAALEELRLIRELRPAANARASRPERYVYLRRRADAVVVSRAPGPWGPIRNRRRAERAARALAGVTEAELERLPAGGPLPRLRARLAELGDALRYEEAARLRDRIEALELVVGDLAVLERMRAVSLWLLVPARERGFTRAYLVAGGRVAATRLLPPGGGMTDELRRALAAACPHEVSLAPEHADELLLVDGFLRRPPPELRVVSAPVLTAAA